MSHPLVLQTIEYLRVIDGMDYFTKAQRLSILKSIGSEVVSEDLGILSEKVLSIRSVEDWEGMPIEVQALLQNICTHPRTPSALTKALYTHTNTPTAAPDISEIEKMQAEIEQQAQEEFQEWIEEETFVQQESETEQTQVQTDTDPVELPIPLDNDNWDIGFILYHPNEQAFYIHFLQSGASQKIPCEEEAREVHPDPYLLSVSTKSIFAQPIPQDVFSSFSTPKFTNREYLNRFNKKKKKVYFLQLRQFHSNPVRQFFRCKGERFQLNVEHENQNLGLCMKQSQSVFVRSQFGYAQQLRGLTPFIKSSGAQHSFTGKSQQSAGWSLEWIGTLSMTIYAKEGNLHFEHLSDGNHSNTITQNLSLSHGEHTTIPISHHQMPYSGMMQTHKGPEVLSFEELAQKESQQRSPQLGKTGAIRNSRVRPILNATACDNQVLLSEQKTVLTTTQNSTPFRVKTHQECIHNTHIIIPCSRSKTLEIHTDDTGRLEVSLGSKTYSFAHISKTNTHTQTSSKTLQSDIHKGWNTSFHEESTVEELHITQTVIHQESGFA